MEDAMTGGDRSRRGAAVWGRQLALAVAVVVVGATPAAASEPALTAATAPVPGDFSTVEVPPVLGESAVQVAVAESGHTLAGVMLDYWRATGADAVYGAPISEPFAASNGYYSQAFERGISSIGPRSCTRSSRSSA
jgi:hypothetical protein